MEVVPDVTSGPWKKIPLSENFLLKMLKKSQILPLFFFGYTQGIFISFYSLPATVNKQEYKYESKQILFCTSQLLTASPKCCLQYSSAEIILFFLLGPLYEEPGGNCSFLGVGTKDSCTSEQLVFKHIMDTLKHVIDQLPLYSQGQMLVHQMPEKNGYSLSFLRLVLGLFYCPLFSFFYFLPFLLSLSFKTWLVMLFCVSIQTDFNFQDILGSEKIDSSFPKFYFNSISSQRNYLPLRGKSRNNQVENKKTILKDLLGHCGRIIYLFLFDFW